MKSKRTFSKILSTAGAVMAIVSGLLWWASGRMQYEMLANAGSPDALLKSSEMLQKAQLFAAQQNLWAGAAAALSAIFIAAAVFFE